MNLLFPRFPVGQLPAMIRIALVGAAVAGTYGALHDQISYAISPEYFTKLKAPQFWYADFGWPERVFAAEVGFIACAAVGLCAGWFLARAGLAAIPTPARRKHLAIAFGIMLLTTMLSGLTGGLIGWAVTRQSDLSSWSEFQRLLELNDLPGFVIVAYLHAAGYIGALVGLLLAIWYIRYRCTAATRNPI